MNIEDRQAILELIYEYSYTYDSNEINKFSNLFTEDGIWDSPIGTARSRKEIFQLLSLRRERIANLGIQNRHFQTNTILSQQSAKQVQGKTMVLVTWQLPDRKYAQVHLTGVYEDEFTKTSSGWKFARRTLKIDQESHNLLIG